MTTQQQQQQQGDGWETFVNKRKQRKKQKLHEKKVWESRKETAPHIILPQHAAALQRKLNIDRLEEQLCSEQWIEYQLEGWQYVRVLKGGLPAPLIDTDTHHYSVLALENDWGDVVLFKKDKSSALEES